MGNTAIARNPLAMMAIARQLRLKRFQIVVMREGLASFADRAGFVNREMFDLAMIRAKISQQGALEIFDLLFTMWDLRGNQTIPAKAFAVGVAPLACSSDGLGSVLRFSLRISDDSNNGAITPKGLHDMLMNIDSTASYFGDTQLEAGDIDNVVNAVFDGGYQKLQHEACVRRLQGNAYIKRFASGKTRDRVKFRSELELVIEFHNPEHNQTKVGVVLVEDNSPETSPVNVLEDMMKETMRVLKVGGASLSHSLCSPMNPRRTESLLDSWESFETQETDTPSQHKDPPSVFPSTPILAH